MFTMLTMGMFGATIALVVYELYDEMHGPRSKLVDRYHE